mgnify:CR=1 FL=1
MWNEELGVRNEESGVRSEELAKQTKVNCKHKVK